MAISIIEHGLDEPRESADDQEGNTEGRPGQELAEWHPGWDQNLSRL